MVCLSVRYEMQVASGVQGQGYGTLLMHALESLARLGKMHKVMLTVFRVNEGAIKFYRHFGWVAVCTLSFGL